MVWTLKKLAQIPSILPSGCKQFLPSYDLSFKLGKRPSKDKISAALAQWYTMAEGEFTDIIGLTKEEAAPFQGRADGATFMQKPLNGRTSSEHAGASDASCQWRKMAAWATTLLRALNHPDCPQGVAEHAYALKKKITSPNSWLVNDKVRQAELRAFAELLNPERLQSAECLATVIRTANKVASQLEDACSAAKNSDWKRHLLGKSKCGKGAYAYAKGPIGCLETPDGPEDQEDEQDLDDEREETTCTEVVDLITARAVQETVIHRGMNSWVSR